MFRQYFVNKLNKKYEGKELFFCHRIYEDIIFLPHVSHKCCHHQILNKEPPIVTQKPNKILSIYSLIKVIDKIMQSNQTDNPECGNCRFLKKQIVPHFNSKYFLKFITISHFTKCNCNCVYCELKDKSKDPEFSILPQIKNLIKQKMINKDCFINWGGGEPTICPEFELICNFLHEQNLRQGINSSGIVFSNAILKGMADKSMNIQISPDSGTYEQYLKIKRSKEYHSVWNNIKKYAQYPDKLYVKYIFFEATACEDEVRTFISKCVECGVKIIVIDCELNSVTNPTRPFGEITDKTVKLAILMKHLAIENSIDYVISYQWKEEHIEIIKNG